MENTIDILERRLAALELKVLPDSENIDLTKLTPVIDCLVQAHGMIGTALSCRDSISSILQYMPQINSWLDPAYEGSDAEERKQYLVNLYPELKEGIALLDDFVKLRDVIESDYFSSVNNLSDRVDRLAISAIDAHKESQNLNETVLDNLRVLQEITKSFKTLFAQLEASMSGLEESAKPKETIDA